MDSTDEELMMNFEKVEVDIYCSGGKEMKFQPHNTPQPENKQRKKYKQIRPKVITEWSHEDIIKLINAVEERPTLWDISSPQYKLPKTSAWQEIADCIGYRNANECKAKWSNLRVSFKTNLSKSKKQKSGSAASQNIVWKYFNAMLFLEVNETSETTESISSMTLPSEESNLSVAESGLPISQKRERKIPPQPSSDGFKEMAAKAICSIAEKSKEKDQFEVFGNHVSAELHSLPLPKALYAKRKLVRALVDIMDKVQSDE